MSDQWKTVRVFISSTFRDMHSERDWLVKRVFPAMRERLRPHKIHLIDVDLRWGITEQEAEDDRVLELCLDQINECQPFFIGLLGERYGWVPESLPEGTLSRFGWVQYQTGKSITELEMLYGVLRDPRMCRYSSFYFRDASFIRDVPVAKRADVCPENATSAGKLARLKQTIRETPLPTPVVDGYACRYAGLRLNWKLARRGIGEADRQTLEQFAEDGIVDPHEYAQLDSRMRELVHRFGVVQLSELEEFGQHVFNSLWTAIKNRFDVPEEAPGDAAESSDPLDLEADFHRDFVETRLRLYVGREELQRRLTGFVEFDASPICLVTGGAGSGKSAAMARFSRDYAAQYPEALVVPHFVGASPQSTKLTLLLRRFCLEVQRFYGSDDDVPYETGDLKTHFQELLEGTADYVKIVFLVDALNQLDDFVDTPIESWLPSDVPEHVKFIVSCMDDDSRGAISKFPQLPASLQRPHLHLELPPLTKEEQHQIVRSLPSISAKKLDARQIELLLSNSATNNPLFLQVALEELRGFGSYEQVTDRIQALPAGDDHLIEKLFTQVIERLQEEFDPVVVRSVLALLAVSRNGLSQTELLELVEGISVEESAGDLFPILRQLRPYLQYRGELLELSHRGLLEAVRQSFLSTDDKRRFFHNQLVQYFRAKLCAPGTGEWTVSSSHALSELPHHCVQGHLWEDLESTLTSLKFLETNIAAGRVFILVNDFKVAVAALPEHRPRRRLLRLLEIAIRQDIHFIHRHREDYPQAFLQCLWNSCWWYDCPDAEQHYEKPVKGWQTLPPWQQPGEKLYTLLEQWREEKECGGDRGLWLRSLRPPSVFLASYQGVTLKGPVRAVESVTFSPDGFRLLSRSDDGIRIWDASSGAELARWGSCGGEATYSTDGARVLTGRVNDGRWFVASWDVTSLACIDDAKSQQLKIIESWQTRNTKKWPRALALSTTETKVAVGFRHGLIIVWDYRAPSAWSGLKQRDADHVLQGHDAPILCLNYSPDGKQIVSSSEDGIVKVWDAEGGTEVMELLGQEYAMSCVQYSPDSSRILGASLDGFTRIWSAVDGQPLAMIACPAQYVCCSPDNRRIATASGGAIHIWDAATQDELGVLKGHDNTVLCLTFSPDGSKLASGSRDTTVRIWDGEDNFHPAPQPLSASCGLVQAFSPDGKLLAIAHSDNMIRLIDAVSGAIVRDMVGHDDVIRCISFSDDGTRIASGSKDTTVRVWDLDKGEMESLLAGHNDDVISVQFVSDSAKVVSRQRWNSESNRKTERLWCVQTGRCLEVAWSTHAEKDAVAQPQWLMSREEPDVALYKSKNRDRNNSVYHFDSGLSLIAQAGHRLAFGSQKQFSLYDIESFHEQEVAAMLKLHHGSFLRELAEKCGNLFRKSSLPEDTRHFDEAVSALREATQQLQRTHGHSEVAFVGECCLAAALIGQRQFAEAERRLLAAYPQFTGEVDLWPLKETYTPSQAVRTLISLYEAWERHAEAEEWKAVLERMA